MRIFKRHIIIYIACTLSVWVVALGAKNEALDLAQAASESGDWEMVAEQAQRAVEAEPKNDDALRLLGKANLYLGDTTAALANYEAALQQNPKQAAAIIELTTLYVGLSRLEDADRIVSEAERKDSRGRLDEIKASRALILGAQGKIGEATPILASATAKNPDNSIYPTMLARIYAHANVPSLAADNYKKAWELDEGNPEIAFEYGQILLQMKEYDTADRLFKIVQERDPDNKTVDFLRGRLRHAAKRYAEAATEFQKSVEKNPHDFLANYWLGKSYVDLSKAEKKNFYAAAIAPLRTALKLKPDREDVAESLAEAQFFVGRMTFYLSQQDTISEEILSRVAEDLNKLTGTEGSPQPVEQGEMLVALRQSASDLRAAAQNLSRDTQTVRERLLSLSILQMRQAIMDVAEIVGSHDVYAHIARAYDRLGDLDSALVYTDLQLAVTPESSGDITRKISLLQRQDHQSALADYLETLVADSAMQDRYGLILVNAHIETGRYDEARSAARRVLAREPGNCDAHQLNAYIDLKRERWASAIAVLLEGVRACPKNSDLWVFLGDSYYFSNEDDKPTVQKAKEAYCRAAELGDRVGKEKCEQVGEILKRMR